MNAIRSPAARDGARASKIRRRLWLLALPVPALVPLCLLVPRMSGSSSLAFASMLAACACLIILNSFRASGLGRAPGIALWCLIAAAALAFIVPGAVFFGLPPLDAAFALLFAIALMAPALEPKGRLLPSISAHAAALILLMESISLLALIFRAFSSDHLRVLPGHGWEIAAIGLLLPSVLSAAPPSRLWPKARPHATERNAYLIVVGVVALGLIFFTAMNLVSSLGAARHEAEARLQAITELKKAEIESHLVEMKQAAEGLKDIPGIGEALDAAIDGAPGGKHRFAQLEATMMTQQAVSEVYILDSAGAPLRGTVGPVPLHVETDTARETMASGKTAFIDLHPHGTGAYRYGFAVPTVTPRGRGVVFIVLMDPYAWLYPLLSHWPIPSATAENLIVRKDGDSVLYLNPLRFDSSPPLSKRIPLARRAVVSVQAVLGRAGLLEGSDYRNSPIMEYIEPVAGTTWFLAARESRQEVLADYYERLGSTIVTLILLVSLSITGFGFALRLRKERELELRLSEEEGRSWLHGIISLSQNEVYVFDPESGKVVFANRGACAALGYEEKELVSMRVGAFLEARDRAAFAVSMKRLAGGSDEKETVYGMHRRKDGSAYPVEAYLQSVRHGDGLAILVLASDISERVAQESERETTLRLLALVNGARDSRALYRSVLEFVQGWSGCEAVGIRLQDDEDFPYFEYSGFAEEFVLKEKSLCSRDERGSVLRDPSGLPYLDCMCGNIIRGRFDPAQPFFTPGGSFWSNCTTELLASTSEADRQARTRNRCNGEGYESVALIPLRSGEANFGLLQLNDRRRGMFSLRFIQTLERLCGSIGQAISEKRLQEALALRERSYRLLFSTMEIGFALHEIVLDAEGIPSDYVFLEANPAFERMTGLSAAEIRGKTVLQVMPGTERSWIDTYGKIALEGGSIRFENYSSVLDKYFEVVAYSPERGRFATLVSDTTERKRAEFRQRAEKEKLSVTLASIGEGVITADEAGRVDIMNRVAESLTGWSAEEARGRPLAEVYSVMAEADRSPLEDPAARARSGNASAGLLEGSILLSRQGKEMLIADSVAPIRDSEGNYFGVVIVFRDIGEQRKLQEAIQRGEKLEALGTIAGGIAHDFNNLLGGVFGFMELAAQGIDEDAPGKKPLRKAMAVFDRAKDLTKQLLTFSKGGAPDRKPGKLEPVLRQCVEFALAGSNVKAEFHFEEGIRPCDFDANQIQQAVDNLAINAKQAMPGGGRFIVTARELELDGSEGKGIAGEFAEVACADTGPGIPPDILGRVFDPFFTTKATGSGLGLATCYSIMKKHGGTLEAESPPGGGALFRFYIPIAKGRVGARPAAKAAPFAASGKVLILDDEEFLLDILGIMLESLGYSSVKAFEGEAALGLLEKEGPFAAAILDLTIPGGKGGLEIVGDIRARYPGLPIFASSGYSENPAMSDPAAYGFAGAIKKPYLFEDVSLAFQALYRR